MVWLEGGGRCQVNHHLLRSVYVCPLKLVEQFFFILEVSADGCFYQKAFWRYLSALSMALSLLGKA